MSSDCMLFLFLKTYLALSETKHISITVLVIRFITGYLQNYAVLFKSTECAGDR